MEAEAVAIRRQEGNQHWHCVQLGFAVLFIAIPWRHWPPNPNFISCGETNQVAALCPRQLWYWRCINIDDCFFKKNKKAKMIWRYVSLSPSPTQMQPKEVYTKKWEADVWDSQIIKSWLEEIKWQRETKSVRGRRYIPPPAPASPHPHPPSKQLLEFFRQKLQNISQERRLGLAQIGDERSQISLSQGDLPDWKAPWRSKGEWCQPTHRPLHWNLSWLRDEHAHTEGSWEVPDTDSEASKSKWLARESLEEMLHINDLHYHKGTPLSPPMCLSHVLYSLSS